MHFKSTAAVALLSSLASAGPILDERAASKKTFTVNQVGIEQEVLPPAVQVLRTYQKYMKNPPTKVAVAAKAALQSGSVVANPQSYDLAYLSQVTVGGQTFNLNFDTGSADLWVYSTLQPSSQTSGRVVYDPSKSKNANLMSSQSWKITYGDGSGAAGKVYADSVVIGGVTATSQAVEAATSVSQQFLNDGQSGGLVGLAFSNLNTVRPNQQSTFFDTVRGTLANKLFTASLKKGAPGSYDFGYIDPAKYSGAITYAPIQASSGFWQFTMGGYTVGGNAANTASMGNGIADTGTTLLYLPDSVASDYWGNVVGAYYSNQFGAYIFPCAANLPTFAISISGRNFVIPSTYMNYAPISNTMCFGGLQSNAGIGFSILGDIFLKSVFVVFDQSQASPRIGFAKQADGSDDSNSTSTFSNSTLPVSSASAVSSALPTTTTVSSSSVVTTTTTTTTLLTTTTSAKIVSSAPSTTVTYASHTTTLSSRASSQPAAAPLTILSSLTAAPIAASSPVLSSSSVSTSLSSSSSVLSTSAEPEPSSASSKPNNASNKTTTTAAAPKPTTTTTTKKTTTTTHKVTTTRKALKKAKTTAKNKKVAKAKKVAACNAKYIAAIKKQYPKQPVRFCKNYKPKAGEKSPVPGIPTAAAVVKVCKCWLSE